MTAGGDLSTMLPHELALAYPEVTRTIWAKEYAEGKLLHYEMGGKVPMDKGPIMAAHDGSGSMGGDRRLWAQSVAVAMCLGAHGEKRDFYGMEFGSRSEFKDWDFPAREAIDPDRMLDYAGHFFGGGTDITLALRGALERVQSHAAFKSADLVIITDGQDRFEDEDAQLVRQLQDLNVRIHGISILTPGNRYLAQACEYVVDVQDLAGPNEATDKVAQNLT